VPPAIVGRIIRAIYIHTEELFMRTFVGYITTLLLTLSVLSALASGQSHEEILATLRDQGSEQGWTFTVDENGATDRSIDELCGLVAPDGWRQDARFDPCIPRRDLPASYDWRDYDGCTSIKNQGSCGSCWAFATVGALECNIKIRDGITKNLSEQWLVSCNSEGYGCGGGWFVHDYHIWKTDPCDDTGYVLEEDFPYVANDVSCACPYPHGTLADGWSYIGTGSGIPAIDAMKQAILDYGPISVGVYVDNAFQYYSGGIFNSDSPGWTNHAVVLVGWDDNQGDGGIWLLRNSWGSGWGEGGYMRIEYGCNSVGDAACYIDYPGLRLGFNYPDGRPETSDPGQPVTFPVDVSAASGTPVSGTGKLHYSTDGSTFSVIDMTQPSPNHYEATLPAGVCYDRIRWYVSAEEEITGEKTDPENAPSETYQTIVATSIVPLFTDDFETNQGWTVSAGASTGNWERADPQEVYYSGTAQVTQPEDDHTPSGTLCYVTQAQAGSGAGSYDVDGGPTRLLSPVLDLSSAQHPSVGYWRWYHICTQWDDPLTVEISNDNGSNWVLVEQIQTRQTWTEMRWFVEDYVSPTSEVRIRFTAWDTDPGSLIEALIDDVVVIDYECEGSLAAPAVSIEQIGSSLVLSWNPVDGATSYQVYSSSESWSGYEIDTTGTFTRTGWEAPLPGDRRYYRVIAHSPGDQSAPSTPVGYDWFDTDIP